jgi:hypothetical protein
MSKAVDLAKQCGYLIAAPYSRKVHSEYHQDFSDWFTYCLTSRIPFSRIHNDNKEGFWVVVDTITLPYAHFTWSDESCQKYRDIIRKYGADSNKDQSLTFGIPDGNERMSCGYMFSLRFIQDIETAKAAMVEVLKVMKELVPSS